MKLEISREELLAGTRLAPKASRAPKEEVRSWLKRQRVANVTTDFPDIATFLLYFGEELMNAVVEEGALNVLEKYATAIDVDKMHDWLMSNPNLTAAERIEIARLCSTANARLYCRTDSGHLLVVQLISSSGIPLLTTFPADHYLEFLDEDNGLLPGSVCHDLADAKDVLSVVFSEWICGFSKSRLARDFLCSVCERAADVVN